MLVVDIRHWLEPDGSLPTQNASLRRHALRVARLIEYGGPLDVNATRETLVECSKRPGGEPCLGLLWVTKIDDKTILAGCPVCRSDGALITGWEGSRWAGGPMKPVPVKQHLPPS